VTKEQRHLRGDRGLQAFAKTQSKEMKTSIEQARRAATAMEVAAQSSEGSLTRGRKIVAEGHRTGFCVPQGFQYASRPVRSTRHIWR
jgi:hypothetical protein